MQKSPTPRYRPPLKRPQAIDAESSAFIGRCPHLGTMADPGTALAFASDANQCYSTRLPVPVSMVHQQSYCLSAVTRSVRFSSRRCGLAEAQPRPW
ncbi:MAG: hypothetical protein R3C44_21135 [Chloroflexota bacterium]